MLKYAVFKKRIISFAIDFITSFGLGVSVYNPSSFLHAQSLQSRIIIFQGAQIKIGQCGGYHIFLSKQLCIYNETVFLKKPTS